LKLSEKVVAQKYESALKRVAELEQKLKDMQNDEPTRIKHLKSELNTMRIRLADSSDYYQE
jgi:hypothetical protein